MKKIRYILLALAIVGLAGGCDTNDDAFYNETYVEIPNLVEIEVQPSYNVGDHLYVDASFSRYLNEPGEDLPLDIFKTTDGADTFDFSYVLEKRSGDEWQTVNITNSMLEINEGGLDNFLPILYAHAYYDPATETYSSNVGIPLETAGDYRLSFNSDHSGRAELRSQSEGNNLTLNISSVVDQLSNGYYSFTVN
ncbi:MAG TPA: hypothetical protein VF676_03915 [Flavobacterium sp.]|jgi:hypothetical protein